MASKDLPKIADVEEESQYGYVFGVSGPGKLMPSTNYTTDEKQVTNSLKVIAPSVIGTYMNSNTLPASGSGLMLLSFGSAVQ